MNPETLRYDVLCALEELEARRRVRGGREWSTAAEVAEHLAVDHVAVRIALTRAADSGAAEEHADWLGCFRLSESGRAVVEDELFGVG